MKAHFFCSKRGDSEQFCHDCSELYRSFSPEEADVVVCLGGDGTMLEAIRRYERFGKKFYGIARRSSRGFLMNPLVTVKELWSKLEAATSTVVPLLTAEVVDNRGELQQVFAVNEVSVTRAGSRMLHLRVAINGQVQLDPLCSDGLLVATPLGSPAHNFSAGGPILPLKSRLLSLQSIAPFSPRGWRGALLEDNAKLELLVQDGKHRPACVSADGKSYLPVSKLTVELAKDRTVHLLFNKDSSLEEKIYQQQFENS